MACMGILLFLLGFITAAMRSDAVALTAILLFVVGTFGLVFCLSKADSDCSIRERDKILNKYKQEIEDYQKFVSNVYLCLSKSDLRDRTEYLCIHKVTKELYEFTAQKIINNTYFFVKEPQKVTTFLQLLNKFNKSAKKIYGDLDETNWEIYFTFMFMSPDCSGEILTKQLLSRDDRIVRGAVFCVHNLVLKDPQERKKFLSNAYQNLPLIKQNLNSLEMGGIFAPNSRFSSRAIEIIEGNNTDICFCRLLIDEFGPSANGLAKEGFLLVQADKKVSDYSIQGIIECPICHKKYSIVEEYTGWHIPTRIYCQEIT